MSLYGCRYRRSPRVCNDSIEKSKQTELDHRIEKKKILKNLVRTVLDRMSQRNCKTSLSFTKNKCATSSDIQGLFSTDGGIIDEVEFARILTNSIMCEIDQLLPVSDQEGICTEKHRKNETICSAGYGKDETNSGTIDTNPKLPSCGEDEGNTSVGTADHGNVSCPNTENTPTINRKKENFLETKSDVPQWKRECTEISDFILAQRYGLTFAIR